MSSISLVSYTTVEVDLERSRITDLDILDNNGVPFLISATRYDGVLQSWQIAGGSLAMVDELVFDGGDAPGLIGSVTEIRTATGTGVLVGGGADGALQVVGLDGDGSLALSTPLETLSADMAAFQHGVSVLLDDGHQAVYGGVAGQAGIANLTFSATGTLISSRTFLTPDGGHSDQVAATAALHIGGQDFIFTADTTQNAVVSWAVSNTGELSVSDHVGVDDGLWINAPSAMQTATIGGSSYLILGSAGSNSLSVMEVGPDGSLILRDHLLDGLASRFAGVTALEVVVHGGQTFVIAGGSDDGISVFVLLEGGHLVSRAHIADSTEMGLDNVSAIAARGREDGLDIFVASSSEPGVTHLWYDAGPTGTTTTAVLAGGLLAGTAGNDILQGHDGDDLIVGDAGDDILRDGDGSDTMTGGEGADLFVLSRDGKTDIITDFTVGEDKLDLSLWPMLRDASQLTFTIQSYGMDVIYGDELLIVRSADGEMIDYRDLTNADLIGDGTRIGFTIEPGYPGPATPTPDPNPTDPQDQPGDTDQPQRIADAISLVSVKNFDNLRAASTGSPVQSQAGSATTITGSAGSDVIDGTTGNDIIHGGDGTDIIMAGAGDDTISGGRGADILLGRTGADVLNGDADGDLIMGGAGNDLLRGGSGDDALYGGLDDDRLEGGAGDDLMLGGDGADTFVFNGGTDIIADYDQGVDRIVLDAALWTGLTSAEDVLAVYGSYADDRATIDLGNGNVLHVDGVLDYATFAEGIDLF